MKISFITSNKHKFQEASLELQKYGIRLELVSTNKIEIQSTNLRDVVFFSILSIYPNIEKPFVIEDAGLFIKSLKWFPGPFSNYVFKTLGCQGILKLMRDIRDRYAKFISIVGYADEKHIVLFEGMIEGKIAYETRGSKGFGFDPIFIPKGSSRTFAEMDIEEKNMFSHRAKAFRKFAIWFLKENQDKV